MSIAPALTESIPVTPDRRARARTWAVRYANEIRDEWIRNGEAPGPEMDNATFILAHAMTVPERDQWMPLRKAMDLMVDLTLSQEPVEPPVTSDDTLDLRDALRTIKTATKQELSRAIGDRLGISSMQADHYVRELATEQLNAKDTALYRHFDDAGTLLYVGISHDADARYKQHMARSEWAPLSARHDVTWFETRAEAEAAERVAIKTESPVFNIVNSTDRSRCVSYLLTRVTARLA